MNSPNNAKNMLVDLKCQSLEQRFG